MAIRSGQSFLLLAATVASVACAAIGYLVIGWIGVGVFGLVTTLVAIQVDMDAVAPIADAQNTGLFARTIAAQSGESRAEQAERRAAAMSRGKILLVAKVLGVIAAAIGGLGFVLVQLPG